MPHGKPYEPSAYPPDQTALIFIDYYSCVVDSLERKDALVQDAEKLLRAAREKKVAILHCLEDLTLDPAPTSRLTETWYHMNRQPFYSANPELVAEHAAKRSTKEHPAVSQFWMMRF